MKKYYVNYKEVSEEDFYKQLEGCIAEYVDNAYDDLLDEDNEEYQIGYLTFSASDVLKNCDPVVYRYCVNNYASSILEEAKCKLENHGYYEISIERFEIEEEE